MIRTSCSFRFSCYRLQSIHDFSDGLLFISQVIKYISMRSLATISCPWVKAKGTKDAFAFLKPEGF